jgi:hypothetical protein
MMAAAAAVLVRHWAAAVSEGSGNGLLLFLFFGRERYATYLVGKDDWFSS